MFATCFARNACAGDADHGDPNTNNNRRGSRCAFRAPKNGAASGRNRHQIPSGFCLRSRVANGRKTKVRLGCSLGNEDRPP
jgi:hypothetical protein